VNGLPMDCHAVASAVSARHCGDAGADGRH
jgi:hypothetical protein